MSTVNINITNNIVTLFNTDILANTGINSFHLRKEETDEVFRASEYEVGYSPSGCNPVIAGGMLLCSKVLYKSDFTFPKSWITWYRQNATEQRSILSFYVIQGMYAEYVGTRNVEVKLRGQLYEATHYYDGQTPDVHVVSNVTPLIASENISGIINDIDFNIAPLIEIIDPYKYYCETYGYDKDRRNGLNCYIYDIGRGGSGVTENLSIVKEANEYIVKRDLPEFTENVNQIFQNSYDDFAIETEYLEIQPLVFVYYTSKDGTVKPINHIYNPYSRLANIGTIHIPMTRNESFVARAVMSYRGDTEYYPSWDERTIDILRDKGR